MSLESFSNITQVLMIDDRAKPRFFKRTKVSISNAFAYFSILKLAYAMVK